MPDTLADARQKVALILEKIAQGVYEKEEVIRLALLAAISGESIFLLGPPGVAKSLIARKLKYAFRDGKSFEYLMNKFSTPDEIFGPVSIKKLKDEDKYERLTEKYLPGANIVFLDEIWKAGPSIQNALLTILNEKVYRNGEQEVEVNIRAIISASNEVPRHADGVDALWDRFLLRYYITEIRNHKNFIQMITSTEDVYEDKVPEDAKITAEEYENWSKSIDQIQIPEEVSSTIQLLKHKITEHNERQASPEEQILVYDRRWKKIIRLLRTSAFLNNREKVDLMDCFLIGHCLWSRPSEFEKINQMLHETICKHGYSLALNLSSLKEELSEFESEVEQETKVKKSIFVDELQSVDLHYLEILDLKQYFDGYLIKRSDFSKLSREETQSISLYDAEKALTNRVNAQLGREENTIDINYNSKMMTFKLRTQKSEQTEIIEKKPHPILVKHWDERVEAIEQFIQKQQNRLENERPDSLDKTAENLFVHPKLSEVVESNWQEVRKKLDSLKLRTEKLAFAYRHLME